MITLCVTWAYSSSLVVLLVDVSIFMSMELAMLRLHVLCAYEEGL